MLLGFPEIGAGGEEQEDDNVETSKLVQEMNRD